MPGSGTARFGARQADAASPPAFYLRKPPFLDTLGLQRHLYGRAKKAYEDRANYPGRVSYPPLGCGQVTVRDPLPGHTAVRCDRALLRVGVDVHNNKEVGP